MSEQQQELETKQYPAKQSAMFAGGAATTMAIVDLIAHTGPTGLLLSGIAGLVAWRHGPEIYEMIGQQVREFIPALPQLNENNQAEPGNGKRTIWDRALGRYPGQVEQNDQPGDVAQQNSEPEPGSVDALFQRAAQEANEGPSVPRFLPNDIIRHTAQDSYQICIGRSLTKRDNPPVWINFYGQHLKLIGASQYGKSSMAAFILYTITRTHAPSKVLISLLDMENKTSKLFADVPHLAEITVNGKPITLHARNRRQVLEHLGYIIDIMEDRYNNMTEEEVEQEPILLVYLEEFLALKDYFKRLIDALTGEAKEQAKKDYAQLVYRVSEIARRGLKVKVQLLMCAQVDYRDEDFQEALINITGGMSFCVRVTAAAAAGFTRTDLLKKNVEDDKKGQAVVETPDCKDLVLAPEYDLKKKLLAYDQARQAKYPAIREQRANMLGPANRQAEQIDNQAYQEPERQVEQIPAPAVPASPSTENQRKLTSLHRQALEHYKPNLGYRQLGEMIGVGKDKAGELIKELRRWGFIENEAAE